MTREELVEKYPVLKGHLCIGEGWLGLVERICREVEEAEKEEPSKTPWVIDQVKEKFGELRFYTHGGPEAVSEFISRVETASYFVCESCGSTSGVDTRGSWSVTLCEKCRKK